MAQEEKLTKHCHMYQAIFFLLPFCPALSHPHSQSSLLHMQSHICTLSMLVTKGGLNSSKCNHQYPRLYQACAFSFTMNMSLSGGLNFGYLCRQWQKQQVQRAKAERTVGRMTTTWRDTALGGS